MDIEFCNIKMQFILQIKYSTNNLHNFNIILKNTMIKKDKTFTKVNMTLRINGI